MDVNDRSVNRLDGSPQMMKQGDSPSRSLSTLVLDKSEQTLAMQYRHDLAGSSRHDKLPVLSLILCSRNDQYQGDSLWRLQTALNFLAENVLVLGIEEDVEVIVTDWGSEIPLHTVLQLSPAAANRITFVVVPPALAQELQQDSPFSEVHALNAAVRRANGHYIGRIDQDTLVGKYFFSTFFQLYEGTQKLDVPLNQALLFANRRRIPYRFAVRSPPFWAVDRFVRWFGNSLLVENHLKHKPHLFYCSYVGIWLLHRDLWYECGGYDERLIFMNEMESDMAARLMGSKHKMVNLGKLADYDFYHLGHNHPKETYEASANRQVNPKRWHELDEEWCPAVLHPNSENWGLIQYPLEALAYSRIGSISKTGKSNLGVLEWLYFIFLMLCTGVQIAWDSLLLWFRAALRSSLSYFSVWMHRARVAWKTVCGQPLIGWPRLLIELWIESKSVQIRQQKD